MRKKLRIWAFAYGLTFMGLSLSIFLPFATAMAQSSGPVNNFLLEICGWGGIQLVAPTSTDQIVEADSSTARIALGHEYCTYCHIVHLPTVDQTSDYFNIGKSTKKRWHIALQERFAESISIPIRPIRGPPSSLTKHFL